MRATGRRALIAAILFLVTAGCTGRAFESPRGESKGRVSSSPIFHKSIGHHIQTLDVAGINKVVLRASKEAAVIRISGTQARIKTQMTYGIAGYHGPREAAGIGDVGYYDMEFDVARAGETLILTSRERWYIHHSLIFDTIELEVPAGIIVEFQTRNP